MIGVARGWLMVVPLVNDVRVWYVSIGAHGAPYVLSREGVNDGNGAWGG
jgi:hypothetical protein